MVEDEIAYGMESLGLPPEVMRRRVEESLDLSGCRISAIDHYERFQAGNSNARRSRPCSPSTQRASCSMSRPLRRSGRSRRGSRRRSNGWAATSAQLTVSMAEHRLERVVQFADRIIHVHQGGYVSDSAPALATVDAPETAPPIGSFERRAMGRTGRHCL